MTPKPWQERSSERFRILLPMLPNGSGVPGLNGMDMKSPAPSCWRLQSPVANGRAGFLCLFQIRTQPTNCGLYEATPPNTIVDGLLSRKIQAHTSGKRPPRRDSWRTKEIAKRKIARARPSARATAVSLPPLESRRDAQAALQNLHLR